MTVGASSCRAAASSTSIASSLLRGEDDLTRRLDDPGLLPGDRGQRVAEVVRVVQTDRPDHGDLGVGHVRGVPASRPSRPRRPRRRPGRRRRPRTPVRSSPRRSSAAGRPRARWPRRPSPAPGRPRRGRAGRTRRSIGSPSSRIRSRRSDRCGEVTSPVCRPKARSSDSIIRAVDVLPFVPVTRMTGYARCGSPRNCGQLRIRSRVGEIRDSGLRASSSRRTSPNRRSGSARRVFRAHGAHRRILRAAPGATGQYARTRAPGRTARRHRPLPRWARGRGLARRT